MVKDVLFAVRANREGGRGGGEVPFPMVFVNEVFPPFFLVLLPLEQGKKRLTVHLGLLGKVHSGIFQNGGGEVDVEGHLFDPRTWFDQFGMTGEHRNADRFLEGIALVVESMFAEGKPVVSKVNHEGILRDSEFVKLVEDTSDVFVQGMHGLAEIVVELVEGGDRVLVQGARFHVIDPMNAISSLFDPEGLGEVILLRVGHGFRVIDLLALIALGMAGRGLEGVVYRLVSDLEEEGLINADQAKKKRDEILGEL